MRTLWRVLLATALLTAAVCPVAVQAEDVVLLAGPDTDIVVTTDPAIDIGMTHARLRGFIVEDDGSACQYRFAYGLTVAYGSNTSWTGSILEGLTFNEEVTGLAVGTTYHFRAEARHASSPLEVAFGADRTFNTTSSLTAPGNFTARTKSDTDISLEWVKGTGSPYTLVRYKLSTWPTDYNDGTVVYNGTGNSVLVEELTPGTTYYFSAWTWSYGGYYSGCDTALASTWTGKGVPPSLYSPGSGSWWSDLFASPDVSKTANLPGYGLVQYFSTQTNIPLATCLLLVGMILVVCLGVVIYTASGQMVAAIGGTGMAMIVLQLLGVVPMYLLVIWLMFTAFGMILFWENRQMATDWGKPAKGLASRPRRAITGGLRSGLGGLYGRVSPSSSARWRYQAGQAEKFAKVERQRDKQRKAMTEMWRRQAEEVRRKIDKRRPGG